MSYLGKKRSPYPTAREITVMRVLKRKPDLAGFEIVETGQGAVPKNQVWMLLQRMKERGVVRVHCRATAREGGLPRPKYRLTAYGLRALEAMAILEGRCK